MNQPAARIRARFNFDWLFARGDHPDAKAPGFDDSTWDPVRIPHDWSIEGPYDKRSPALNRGGYLTGGIGWYRKHFHYSESLPFALLEFDGVYMNAEVWINGHYLGKRPYGFSSFAYDISAYLHPEPEENVLAVRVDNSLQPNCRWYSGSGIYRHVWLTTTGALHVAHWGTSITTPVISETEATVRICTTIENTGDSASACSLRHTIQDASGSIITSINADLPTIDRNGMTEHTQELSIGSPQLWSTESPYLYTMKTEVLCNGTVMDTYEMPFGIRTLRFDPDHGFFLNGSKTIFKGVCLHHDAGPLGAAVPDRASERQLEILKAMGCNAIRTSHNPPAPAFLELCDRMGFLVQVEAFDEWKSSKACLCVQAGGIGARVPIIGGYASLFEEWSERDLTDMIRRDRNHPSVIMWSIGNEVVEQNTDDGGEIAKQLVEIVHREDPTRPATAGLNFIDSCNENGLADALDIVGYNYFGSGWKNGHERYPEEHTRYPERFIYGSETNSCISSRGVYHTDLADGHTFAKQSAAYDRDFGNKPSWTTSSEYNWKAVIDHPFVGGQFIWTGFDYIGEPTPYPYPSKSSYFGLIDLCGFPKDSYYFHQAHWTDRDILHLFPHWNWTTGESVSVWCHTNCDEVELFLNNRSLGIQKLCDTDALHLEWSVPFEPGVLKAVGLRQGRTCTAEVRTAGEATQIELTADRTSLSADGQDLAYLTARVLDSAGIMLPDAEMRIDFMLEGPGRIVGTGNGDPTCHDVHTDPSRRAFHGMCLAIVQTDHTAGTLEVTASARGLKEARVALQAQ